MPLNENEEKTSTDIIKKKDTQKTIQETDREKLDAKFAKK